MSAILLINPPIQTQDVYSKFAKVAPNLPPLGICYLGTFLKAAGFTVRIIDCPSNQVTLSDLTKLIQSVEFPIVGVSSTTVSFKSAVEVFTMLKVTAPKTLTILGGAHLNATRTGALKECNAIDIGVLGEGEHTLLEICNRHKQNLSLDSIPGTIVRVGKEIKINPARMLEPFIDSFPIPDRELLGDIGFYSHSPFRGAGLTISMISSRGCPFGCSYCDQSIFGKTWRAHSAERVVEEMTRIVSKYNANFISFEDDNFLLNRARVVAICKLIIAQNLSVQWGCSVRVDTLEPNLLTLMKLAGCRLLYIGIESGSPRMLKLLNRNLTIKQIRDAVLMIKRLGLKVYGAFILGLPTETRSEINQTIQFSLKLPLDAASYFLFTPYPNTGLRSLAEASGSVSQDWGDYSAHPSKLPFIPNSISEAELLKLQATAYRKFFLRWRYIRSHQKTILSKSFLRQSLPMLRKLI